MSEREFDVNLTQLLSAGEIRFSKNRDVAIVRVEQCSPDDLRLFNFVSGVVPSTEHTGVSLGGPGSICRMNEVDVGADVYMFGYPTSVTGPFGGILDPSEPLLRKGIVAGVSLRSMSIIIDCPAYFGNSGGPVIQVDHPDFTSTRFRVIGIVSGFVPFLEVWENKTMQYSHVIESNSGYTIVEPIDSALDLAWR